MSYNTRKKKKEQHPTFSGTTNEEEMCAEGLLIICNYSNEDINTVYATGPVSTIVPIFFFFTFMNQKTIFNNCVSIFRKEVIHHNSYKQINPTFCEYNLNYIINII